MVHTLLDNLRDQWLISLCHDVPPFSSYIKNKDNFRDHFVLVKSPTLEAHYFFYLASNELPLPVSFQDLPPIKCTH